jgi:hypothetical protein
LTSTRIRSANILLTYSLPVALGYEITRNAGVGLLSLLLFTEKLLERGEALTAAQLRDPDLLISDGHAFLEFNLPSQRWPVESHEK